MRKNRVNGNLALSGFDDIFQSSVPSIAQSGECIEIIPLTELFPPEFHPFLVTDGEAMTRLSNSVRLYGVREPGLARPRAEGGYELLAGNRRKRACEIAGIAAMPVIVRQMDDDSAAIAMVDSNLEQREKLLFSEKAWAYRVKLEALNHRGQKSDTPGQLSVDILCEQTGESKNTIYRLIRLTELVPDMIDRVDSRQLAFNPAVELSYLSRKEQALVVDTMVKHEVKPSLSQAQRMKKESQGGTLTPCMIESILSEPKQTAEKSIPLITEYKRFFPDGYTPEQINDVLVELLTIWQSKRTSKQQ